MINPDLSDILLTQQTLHARIAALGEALCEDYRGKDPVFICVLKGAVHFFAELMLCTPIACAYDFVTCSSYGGGTQTAGSVALTGKLSLDVTGRDVVVVDDILDSGLTLAYLRTYILQRNPASVKLCVLMDKPERRRAEISADYVGFTIPNVFVVGYGLDYNQRYRNLPYIGILKPEIYGGL